MKDIVWKEFDAFVGPVRVGSIAYDAIYGKGYNAYCILPQSKRFEQAFPTQDEARLAVEKRVINWFKAVSKN